MRPKIGALVTERRELGEALVGHGGGVGAVLTDAESGQRYVVVESIAGEGDGCPASIRLSGGHRVELDAARFQDGLLIVGEQRWRVSAPDGDALPDASGIAPTVLTRDRARLAARREAVAAVARLSIASAGDARAAGVVAAYEQYAGLSSEERLGVRRAWEGIGGDVAGDSVLAQLRDAEVTAWQEALAGGAEMAASRARRAESVSEQRRWSGIAAECEEVLGRLRRA